MVSKVASEISRRRLQKIAALTVAERISLATRLGEESVAIEMACHGIDRRTAVARIKATRRLGRPHSRSASR